ncbi:neural cell adhesion molecule 2-like [Contarinia nasturtii]|uniref:neural cell adhesion molecule 2-like n=1 Tax=Contarinia nasturtii TaxID=265458 RepID=UPI0012D4B842|nr:neural cell adhesion molecule 2-like [Contarinia nasturtii]XP_031634906.1 neural cell adhesion molecule 2-like [Contarinia nasturtii]
MEAIKHKIFNIYYFYMLWMFCTELILVNASEEQSFEPKLMPSVNEVMHSENDTYIVSCAGDGVRVRWFDPNNKWIDPMDRGHVHVEERNSESLLIFTSISPEDRGNWTCQAENNTRRAGFNMIVYKPITFLDSQNVQSVKENDDAVIKCMVDGDPEPSISWYYNGQPLNLDGNKYRGLADGLLIKEVQKGEEGEYTCSAFQISSAKSNIEEKTIRLNIQHKPIIPVHRESADVQYGYLKGYVDIICEAEAEPPATFRWYRNKQRLDPGEYEISYGEHSSTLRILLSDGDQFGAYVCESSNSLGTLKRDIVLVNGTKPNPPPYITLRGVNSNTFDLDVGAKKIGEPDEMDVIGYRFEIISKEEHQNESKWLNARVVKKDFTEGVTYLINNLSPNTTYLIRVASVNRAGMSEWLGPREFETHAKEGFGHTSTSTHSGSQHNVVAMNLIHLLIFYIAYEFFSLT